MDLTNENSYPTPYANTSILPLLVLSLMQQRITPKVSESFKPEYDFIIVGAGSAGSVVASRLSEVPCVSVLLLEAGKSPPVLTDVPALEDSYLWTDISWLYKTVPQKHTASAMLNRQVKWPSGKVLGGSSILNRMYYVRGNRQNYDDWAEQGAVGWSYSDVKPYFLKAENNTEPEYLENGYHTVDGPLTVEKVFQSELTNVLFETAQNFGYNIVDSNGRTQTGFDNVLATTRNGQRCSTAKAYLVPAENRTNFDILTNAFVKQIVIENGRAAGVLVEYEGITYTIYAKREVIVSAGTINSAQLLMLSGIGPKEHLQELNIPVQSDLPVGKNLQDHCGSFVHYVVDPRIASIEQDLLNETNVQDYIENRTGPLTYVGSDILAFLPETVNPQLDFPDYQLYFGLSFPAAIDPYYNLKPEVVAKFGYPEGNYTLYVCFAHHLQPKSRGTVKLQSADPQDPPLIDPNYFDNPEDIRPIVEGLKLCKRMGMDEAVKNAGVEIYSFPLPGCEDSVDNDDQYFECILRAGVYTMSNPVGTAKMGDPEDSTAVVDSRLRVKGINGLRVVDASVMPIIPSGNTNIPTIMIAEKASDMIKNTLDCYTQTPV